MKKIKKATALSEAVKLPAQHVPPQIPSGGGRVGLLCGTPPKPNLSRRETEPAVVRHCVPQPPHTVRRYSSVRPLFQVSLLAKTGQNGVSWRRRVKKSLAHGKRIPDKLCSRLYELDLLTLGKLADLARRRIIGSEKVGFVIDRNVTFTNICVCRCNFCAFYRDGKSDEAFSLTLAQILKKVGELVQLGGTQVMLQGGLSPEHGLDFYVKMLSAIKAKFPRIYLHSLSPAEVHYLAVLEHTTHKEILKRLKTAGLDSLPGAAEILVDKVRRKVSPGKLKTADWLNIMRSAHSIGMQTTATMTFGLGETRNDRIEHLLKLRKLQDETGGFRAFIPWTFSPEKTGMPEMRRIGGQEYLKTVAVSRLVLDNFRNIHSGWVTEGPRLAQTALLFGANDMGGILMEEVVVKATGISHTMTKEKVIELIKGAGKTPVLRNSRYEILKEFQTPM